MIKLIILGFWIVVAAALVVPLPGDVNQTLIMTGGLILAIHLVEYFLYKKRIDDKGDGFSKSFFMTMVYGLAYIRGR